MHESAWQALSSSHSLHIVVLVRLDSLHSTSVYYSALQAIYHKLSVQVYSVTISVLAIHGVF
jgi:hypothetical protein